MSKIHHPVTLSSVEANRLCVVEVLNQRSIAWTAAAVRKKMYVYFRRRHPKRPDEYTVVLSPLWRVSMTSAIAV